MQHWPCQAAWPCQVLADRIGVDAALVRSAYKRGAHAHHAWNMVVGDDGQACVIDLMFEPGKLLAEGVGASKGMPKRFGLTTRHPIVKAIVISPIHPRPITAAIIAHHGAITEL